MLPVAPCRPLSPLSPFAPWSPLSPFAPWSPLGPLITRSIGLSLVLSIDHVSLPLASTAGFQVLPFLPSAPTTVPKFLNVDSLSNLYCNTLLLIWNVGVLPSAPLMFLVDGSVVVLSIFHDKLPAVSTAGFQVLPFSPTTVPKDL